MHIYIYVYIYIYTITRYILYFQIAKCVHPSWYVMDGNCMAHAQESNSEIIWSWLQLSKLDAKTCVLRIFDSSFTCSRTSKEKDYIEIDNFSPAHEWSRVSVLFPFLKKPFFLTYAEYPKPTATSTARRKTNDRTKDNDFLVLCHARSTHARSNCPGNWTWIWRVKGWMLHVHLIGGLEHVIFFHILGIS